MLLSYASDRFHKNLLCITFFGLVLGGCSSQFASAPAAPKMILIIGDGMDDHQITIARTYLQGGNGRLTLDNMPFRGAVQIQGVSERNPMQPVYVSDSANTATSMATGAITSPSRIATTAGADQRLTTVMELAQDAGFATGLVSTAALTDATPASFVAHINQRGCQGPSDMMSSQSRFGMTSELNCSQYLRENGGLGSISEQLVASGVDIMLGGGAQYFDQASELESSKTVIDEAAENGYQIVRSKEELEGVTKDNKVLGLFSSSTMPVRLRGEDGARAVAIERADGQVRLPEIFSCEANPDFSGVPELAVMTQAALEHFDADEGFMLMVESASIDKQSHGRNPCGSIGEVAQLNEALDVALAYAELHPETLILVTADHSQAAQLAYSESPFLRLNFASPGHFARIRTPEGGIMGVNYATNDSPILEDHTGAQIPLFGFGPGLNSLPTFMYQVEIFDAIVAHLNLRN